MSNFTLRLDNFIAAYFAVRVTGAIRLNALMRLNSTWKMKSCFGIALNILSTYVVDAIRSLRLNKFVYFEIVLGNGYLKILRTGQKILLTFR